MAETSDYKKQVNQDWLDENCKISGLIGPRLTPMRPDLGFYIKVNNLEIPGDIFPEEYIKIMQAYNKVLDKLDEHYKNHTKDN